MKRVRAAKIHILIMGHLRKQMPSMMGKQKAQDKLLRDLPTHFAHVQREHHLPAGAPQRPASPMPHPGMVVNHLALRWGQVAAWRARAPPARGCTPVPAFPMPHPSMAIMRAIRIVMASCSTAFPLQRAVSVRECLSALQPLP